MWRRCSAVLLISISLVNSAIADDNEGKPNASGAADPSIVAFHGEVACQNLPGADFKPGQLKLPLTVHERSGVERKAAIVSAGVPFPPGFLPDVSKLRVVDKGGTPVICQAAVMVKWWKPAYDDSVQWAMVSFLADVPAEGKAVYYLTDDGKGEAASPLNVSKTDKQITIDTGAASFAVPLAGESLLSAARIGGAEVLGSAGLRGVVVAGDWPDRGLKAGDRLVTSHAPKGVTVEESGPARVVVCIKGGYAPGDKDKKYYSFTARLTFAANDPAVRLVYSLDNTHLDAKLYDSDKGKSRLAYIWPMQDVSLVADLAIGDKAAASTVGDGKLISAEVNDQPLTLCQSKLDGFQVSLAGKEQAAGKESPGALGVTGGGRGLAVARRYFHSEWPGVLAGSAKELRIGLLPRESGEKFHLNVGNRKSWDLRLNFHGAKSPDLKSLSAEQETLLLFRPEPAWMVRAAGITGSWSAGLHLEPTPAKLALRRKPGKLEQTTSRPDGLVLPKNGWDYFGVIRAWNAGGGHWNEESAFAKWVIHGDGDEFDSSEVRTLWAADLCPVQFEDPDIGAFGSYIYYQRYGLARLQVLTYPGYVNRQRGEGPDTGHMGMWMWHQYYLVTGDVRAREATCNLGNFARAHLWRHTHDGRADDTGPEAGPGGYRKRNPDADPDFKLERRYDGWPLYCLMQNYQFTGNPDVLAEGRIAARAFRNTARTSPIGQMVKDAASKTGGQDPDDKKTHSMEYPTAIFAGASGSPSQLRDCRKSASLCSSNFYNGYILSAVREYYTHSRDIEALDTLVGQADHFCKHIMLCTPEGKLGGWTYIFADYWGPYTWEDAAGDAAIYGGKSSTRSWAGFLSSNVWVSDALASLYHATGKPDVLDVVKAASATITPADMASGYDNRTNCLFMAVRHPKVDQTPPAAIKDLMAEPLGGGKVKLTWTAPGGDGDKGQAAWYQAKWSPAPIVELTKGWPDKTEPLPATNKEWHERAAAFNAKQLAFWSANNLAGAPKPAPAGARESMTVEGLPAGKMHLTIKAWDEASNIGPLSNVIEVMVK